MTWIAVCDFDKPVFNLNGVDSPVLTHSGATDVLVKGTLLLEAMISPSKTDHVLLDYRCGGDWPFRLNIQKATDGTFWIYIEQSAAQNHLHAIETDLAHFAGTVQLNYSWNGPKRIGLLTISVAQTGQVFSTQLDAPCPMPLQALSDMTLSGNGQLFTQATRFFAISDQIEPIGVQTSISPFGVIKTPNGLRQLSDLHQGMMVDCSRYGAQPVEWVQTQTRPAAGSNLPIRLLAPFLGLKQDLIVAADQRVAMGGPDVEYLFGEETVLVQAKDLIHGPMANIASGYRTIDYTQVYLQRHALMNVNGCDMESLFVTEMTQTALMGLDANHPFRDLTEFHPHHTLARPCLRGFEAMTLNKVLAA